ncbi:DJ-1/PfpI family protein [Archangium violaceum]|uniref:DJ-1/PfpI family protein n=1 Tax=Archangium violaceum TaxID=83451 RepID=UPI00193B3FBC|nr:DJ-1/PfpI family protein [Archangium violaceum]QRK04843.1 DJ-1/PfpI family protein [Archangium violaceum]
MNPPLLSSRLAPWARLGLAVIATLLAVPVACAHSAERNQKISVAILLFPGFDPLDVVGPLELYSYNPEFDVSLVAKTLDRVPSSNPLVALDPTSTLEAFEHPDVLVIPGGGTGVAAARKDPVILNWIKTAHQTSRYTTSVCTGALILGEAGLLEGKKATTHWELQSRLADHGASYQDSRYVQDGKVITSAGVSAGMDMSLYLIGLLSGETMAQAVQLAVQYDPQPPFDSGHPSRASQEVLDLLKAIREAP